jgi:hypothetical protein
VQEQYVKAAEFSMQLAGPKRCRMLAVLKADHVNCSVWLLPVGRMYLRCLACCALLQGVLLPEELEFVLQQRHAGTAVGPGPLFT